MVSLLPVTVINFKTDFPNIGAGGAHADPDGLPGRDFVSCQGIILGIVKVEASTITIAGFASIFRGLGFSH